MEDMTRYQDDVEVEEVQENQDVEALEWDLGEVEESTQEYAVLLTTGYY